MRTHPVFLRLDGRACVVVGGDAAAESKVAGCLEARAVVRVIAPEVTAGLAARATEGALVWLRREYQAGDLAGVFLAYAVTRDPALIARLRAEGDRERVLLNVLDVPEACTFFAPAIVDRGDLRIAVGTGGASPALAGRLRRQLEEVVGVEYTTLVAILGAVRRRLEGDSSRRAVTDSLLDSPLLELVRRRDRAGIDTLLGRVAGAGCTLAALGVEAPG